MKVTPLRKDLRSRNKDRKRTAYNLHITPGDYKADDLTHLCLVAEYSDYEYAMTLTRDDVFKLIDVLVKRASDFTRGPLSLG